MILLRRIDRIEGSSPVHPTSLLILENVSSGFQWMLLMTVIDWFRNQIINLFPIIDMYHYQNWK